MPEIEEKKVSKVNLEENEKIKTQIDASIGIARTLISSWLPPLKPGEKDEDEDDNIAINYSTGRPDRLGLGAKFLSHAEAMRHKDNGQPSSKQEIMLKNKILNQNRKAAEKPVPIGKRYRPSQDNEDSESDEEESRSSTVGVGKKNNNKKSKAAVPPPAQKKKIGQQGDFLSMYLNERAGKKKNKK